jgi:alkylation response protein AidB-like acyl-CoA dehydrogenase
MARGEVLGAFALTEREAGSDAGALRTHARKDGDGWVLNGEKVMITNGGPAGLLLTVRHDRSRARRQGRDRVPRAGRRRGHHARAARPHDGAEARGRARRPLRERAGSVRRRGSARTGRGMKVALAALNVGRIGVAAQATGIAAEMVDRAVAYARWPQAVRPADRRFGACRRAARRHGGRSRRRTAS